MKGGGTMDGIIFILRNAIHNKMIELVIVCVVVDTVFGLLRAAKERKFNSNFGINGAIRKAGMLVALGALLFIDAIVDLNLIGFIPEEVRQYFGSGHVGTMEFFGLLFVVYEIVSILKNMTLCGLPVKRVWLTIRKVLLKYTDELPDDEGMAEDEAADGGQTKAG